MKNESNWSPFASSRSRRIRRQGGFTIIETIIAIVLFLIFAGIATFSLTQGLRSKNSQETYLELQQNLRVALQQLTQDVRAATKVGPWNDPASGCDDQRDACSLRDRLSILATTGRLTDVAEQAGSTYTNSTRTHVCDARGFRRGNLVVIMNGGAFYLIKLSGVRRTRDYGQPCSLTNRDELRHNRTPISGTWANSTYAYQVRVVTYELIPDPLDPGRTVLYRRVGNGATPGAGSGIVAFDVDGLKLSYGVPLNPSAGDTSVQRLRFYDSLSDAAAALGSGYSDDPNGSGTYVGTVVRAIRVTLSGTTPKPLRTGGTPGHYELTETIDLR
jgi:prepilin-type N-terminal cleavage/methylation domain-containing protein